MTPVNYNPKSGIISVRTSTHFAPDSDKPAVAVRKTASADLGNPYEDAKKTPFLRIEPLIVGELFTKIG